MATWEQMKAMMAGAAPARTMERARSALGRGTRYRLGRGGFDPTRDAPEKQCDCSGFVAWAIGIPRELPPGSGRWLDTDAYYRGGGPALDGLSAQIDSGPQAGDLYVYPDNSRTGQGHIGIISRLNRSGQPDRVIHCSTGNDRRHGNAIRETGTGVFTGRPYGTRIMRIQYPLLLRRFGVAEALRKPRLILAKWEADSGPPRYEYRPFPEAVFREDRFWLPPAALAEWLGRTGEHRTGLLPLREALGELGLVFGVSLKHLADAEDPRAYVFLPHP